ncbi:uncharacterized protein BP5553_09951 [Venustampulla echinocandica]|uniref:Uncharacterized protein n=1 Tax=Venustampulla echinocandica TaxID=2656787 RepID=A0A370TB60_9HELO|nr:uncharacterized protein BP5553_09951 [Venustampulla echinocandica]RDL31162.1 hypothetical protein BP5553_09951 [Venustampulla echinocandica]
MGRLLRVTLPHDQADKEIPFLFYFSAPARLLVHSKLASSQTPCAQPVLQARKFVLGYRRHAADLDRPRIRHAVRRPKTAIPLMLNISNSQTLKHPPNEALSRRDAEPGLRTSYGASLSRIIEASRDRIQKAAIVAGPEIARVGVSDFVSWPTYDQSSVGNSVVACFKPFPISRIDPGLGCNNVNDAKHSTARPVLPIGTRLRLLSWGNPGPVGRQKPYCYSPSLHNRTRQSEPDLHPFSQCRNLRASRINFENTAWAWLHRGTMS